MPDHEQPNKPKNTHMNIYELERDLKARDAAFFTEAFTDPVTREPYELPENIKRLATRLCRSYGIKGSCDPMYIANVIAVELGLGDGMGHFTVKGDA